MKKIILGLLMICFGLFIVLYSCKKDKKITPVQFPDVAIKNFKFPEDSTTINKWLSKQDTAQIISHAWGIWAGLTEPTNQKYNGQTLLVFETWLGIQEIANSSNNNTSKINRTALNVPKQFIHGALKDPQVIDTTFQVLETVSYDPWAANFAISNQLLTSSKLRSYAVTDGIGSIPDFPNASIVTKPTYYTGIPDKNSLIRVPVWVSPVPAKAFRSSDWKTWVYADINNRQKPNKILVPVTSSNPSKKEIENATCNLNEFINYKLDEEGAEYLNLHEDFNSTTYKDGDYVLLVAMHVATKEIKNWTWQTYFWCPDPKNPPSPSSKFAADLKPKELKGAASHYAVSVAYAMVWPNQPITGGSDKNTRPIISFNPYLEGGFGPKVFNYPNTYKPEFIYGMQTNCMSCHALATYKGTAGYTTDQYIDMKNLKLFKNDIQLDFLWSIQGNMDTLK
jgi:hypothetical protein